MKTKTICAVTALLLVANTFSQKLNIDLTFTAIDNTTFVQLDSIKVMNLTQENVNMIYWPDTSAAIDINAGDTLLYIGYITGSPIGIEDLNHEKNNFQLSHNYPNPATNNTIFTVSVPEEGDVQFLVIDITGKVVLISENFLSQGTHRFRYSPGNGNIYILTARWRGISQSIKIIASEPNSKKKCTIDHLESNNSIIQKKASSYRNNSALESGILDVPSTDKTITFQFAYKIPCPGIPTVTYSGQVYNTVQIFSQCWLKDNLNIGTMINSATDMTDNSTIEKYCYDNNPVNCNTYGGLYQWNEMMQYTNQEGSQGICPPGWHIPIDEEWKILEGAADLQYWIGDAEWNTTGINGFDACTNLKSTYGWDGYGNGTDYLGFTGLPGGICNAAGAYFHIGFYGYWWTSTEFNLGEAWDHFLNYNSPDIYRLHNEKGYAFSVRCVRD